MFQGKKMDKDGKAVLTGIAMIPESDNFMMDQFLGLPNEALAILECKFT